MRSSCFLHFFFSTCSCLSQGQGKPHLKEQCHLGFFLIPVLLLDVCLVTVHFFWTQSFDNGSSSESVPYCTSVSDLEQYSPFAGCALLSSHRYTERPRRVCEYGGVSLTDCGVLSVLQYLSLQQKCFLRISSLTLLTEDWTHTPVAPGHTRPLFIRPTPPGLFHKDTTRSTLWGTN